MKFFLLLVALFTLSETFFSSNSLIFSNKSDTIIVSKKNKILVSDTTHNCMVVTLSKNVYKKVNLFGLSDSSVKILDKDYSHLLLIDSIQSITFYGRGYWTGAAIGGGIGMLLALISGGSLFVLGSHPIHDYNFWTAFQVGLIASVPFALIGGALGAGFAKDDIYDLSTLDFAAKRKKLIYLMRKYSDK